MDPLTIGLMAIGTGLQIFGGLSGASNSREQARLSEDVATQEQAINVQKQQQMQLQAQRARLENFRNVNRAKAAGLNAATNQGAQFGSGIAGGQAQATDQGLYNSLDINQNLSIGDSIAGYNSKISQDRIQMAKLGGDAATDAGLASLGGAFVKSGPTIGAIGKGFGSFNFNSLFGGGSPSGYGA